MRLKLIAKSDPDGTICSESIQVVNAETGEPLEWVRSVDFHAAVDDNVTLRVEVLFAEAEIEGLAEVAVAPPEEVAPGIADVTSFGDEFHSYAKVGQ